MKTNCIVLSDSDLADVRKEMAQIQRIVQTATGALAAMIRTNAPRKSGDLIKGIVPSPWEENSAYPGKIVRQVYMDAGMNDTFVKITKSGKRYYYPASQEYGFKVPKRTIGPKPLWLRKTPAYSREYYKAMYNNYYGIRTIPGKFFMRDTFAEYVPAFVSEVEDFVDEVVDK